MNLSLNVSMFAVTCHNFIILLYFIILNLPQFTNDLQIHLKYMY